MQRPSLLPPESSGLSRRRFLALGGSAAAGAVLLVACGGDDSTSSSADTTAPASNTTGTGATDTTAPSDLTTGTPADTVFTAADFAGLGACMLLPDLTQGPYPTIEQIERRDITEGKAGLPLRVGIQVVDESCTPLPNAVVEIWHCDIDGDYSAYADGYRSDDAGAGTTYFRGNQVANADGIVEFHTVYPGWYRGRAVHIHAMVHIDDRTPLTTQFLFADELNDEILATDPYAPFGPPDTTNAADSTTGGSAEADGLLMTVSDDAAIDGRRALIVVGLDPAGSSQGASGGGPGGGGPGGGRPTPPDGNA